MTTTLETLRSAVCAASGKTEAELDDDLVLAKLGVDQEDVQDAFEATCEVLGFEPDEIDWDVDPVRYGPTDGVILALRHLAPFWSKAEAARREVERSRRQPPDPTLRSLAATIDARRFVAAGPDLVAEPIPALSAPHALLRAASLAVITLVGLPGIGHVTCGGPCRACHGSLAEAAQSALPLTGAAFLAVMLVVLLPGVLYLRQGVRAAVEKG
jgi:hypothetical protein